MQVSWSEVTCTSGTWKYQNSLKLDDALIPGVGIGMSTKHNEFSNEREKKNDSRKKIDQLLFYVSWRK